MSQSSSSWGSIRVTRRTGSRVAARAMALGLLAAALPAQGCARSRAQAALERGTEAFKAEDFETAIAEYELATRLAPDLAEAHFYLAASHQALFRPARDDRANREHLDIAIAEYELALEHGRRRPDSSALVENTLSVLAAIHGDKPVCDYDSAISYANLRVQRNPSNIPSLFALARLHEEFGRIDRAEHAYLRAWEVDPADIKACGALAAFYNRPLWEGRPRFDDAATVLERCASNAPADPSRLLRVSALFCEKAYRDTTLSGAQRRDYALKGLEAAERALELKAGWVDAIVHKGLICRWLMSEPAVSTASLPPTCGDVPRPGSDPAVGWQFELHENEEAPYRPCLDPQ